MKGKHVLNTTFVTQGPQTRRLLFFYLIIYYIASTCAYKYFLQNENILHLTEVRNTCILVWLEQSKTEKFE